MKFAIHLKKEQIKQLEFEVVSTELKAYLVRLVERKERFRKQPLIHMNFLINRSRAIAGKPIYVLESDDLGMYQDAEYAWHYGEFELIFRRLDTAQFVEFLCGIIEDEWLELDEVNQALSDEGVSFSITEHLGSIIAEVLSIEELRDKPLDQEHPNIRLLIDRMETALDTKDYGGVLHASASVFETLAKDIVGIPTVQNQTLKSFFSRYEKDSKLPKDLQKKILAIYDARNVTPLAGHGSLDTPKISSKRAVTLCEMTKAFVRIEYILRMKTEMNQRASAAEQQR